MKKIYFFLLLTVSFAKGFTQRCIPLGCASAHTGLITDGTLTDTSVSPGLGCYAGNLFKQIYWEYFFSPSGGDFTQTFTPTSGTNLATNWVIFDEGTAAPASVTCPVDYTAWTSAACDITDHPNLPVGPGLFSQTLTTTAGHYYAVAIIQWQGTNNGGDASYTFDISAPLLGGAALTPANCPGVLPVKLSSFDATINNCMVNLNWVGQSSGDFKNYEVQYSSDGTRFQSLATGIESVQGTAQKYSYQDKNPKQGTIYYRLKMTDEDGKYEYSKIIALKLNCNRSSLFVYPNPVTDILNVNISNIGNETTIASLFAANGKMVYSGEMNNGTNIINMQKFAKGVYVLRLKNNTDIQNIKIIK